MNTISIRQFPTLQTVQHVHCIVLGTAFGIWFLNTTTRRRIIMCYRQTYHRPVGQVDWTLYKTLSESTTTNNRSTILILNSSCNNLCSRGRITIDKNHDLPLLERSFSVSSIIHTWNFSSLRINDQVAFCQELISDVNSRFQVAAAILLKVKQQMAHPLFT